MADKKKKDLPEGFTEAPLPEGFTEAPTAEGIPEGFTEAPLPEGFTEAPAGEDLPWDVRTEEPKKGMPTVSVRGLGEKDPTTGETLTSFTGGLAQGASLGMRAPLDYATAAGEYLRQARSPTEKANFEEALDYTRKQRRAAEEAAPGANIGGQVVGTLGTAFIPGMPAALAAQGAAKVAAPVGAAAAGLLARGAAQGVAQQGLFARAVGAVTGLGVEGAVASAPFGAAHELDKAIEAQDYTGVAEKMVRGAGREALTGAGYNIGLGGALGLARKALPTASEVTDFASGRAFKGLGGTKKDIRIADERIGGLEIGRQMLDEGVITKADTSLEGTYDRAESLRTLLGRQLGALRDRAAKLVGSTGVGPTKSGLADAIEREVIAPVHANEVTRASARRYRANNRDLLEALEANRPEPVRPEVLDTWTPEDVTPRQGEMFDAEQLALPEYAPDVVPESVAPRQHYEPDSQTSLFQDEQLPLDLAAEQAPRPPPEQLAFEEAGGGLPSRSPQEQLALFRDRGPAPAARSLAEQQSLFPAEAPPPYEAPSLGSRDDQLSMFRAVPKQGEQLPLPGTELAPERPWSTGQEPLFPPEQLPLLDTGAPLPPQARGVPRGEQMSLLDTSLPAREQAAGMRQMSLYGEQLPLSAPRGQLDLIDQGLPAAPGELPPRGAPQQTSLSFEGDQQSLFPPPEGMPSAFPPVGSVPETRQTSLFGGEQLGMQRMGRGAQQQSLFDTGVPRAPAPPLELPVRPGPNPDTLDMNQLNDWRIAIDDRSAAWDTLEAKQDAKLARRTRAVMDKYWMDAVEEAANRSGDTNLIAEVKSVKDRYAKVAVASDLLEESVSRKAANRTLSMSDMQVGQAGTLLAAASGEPVSLWATAKGVAAAVGNKILRERGNFFMSSALHGATKRAMKVQGALKKSAALTKLTSKLKKELQSPESLPVTEVGRQKERKKERDHADVSRAVEQAEKLKDPESDEAKRTTSYLQEMEPEAGPEIVNALRDKMTAQADFILEKAGPAPPPSPFGGPPPKRDIDPDQQATLSRSLDALSAPEDALARVGAGVAEPEDYEVLERIYPRMWQEFQQTAVQGLADKNLDSDQQIAVAEALKLPLVPAIGGEYMAFWQNVAAQGQIQDQMKADEAAATANKAKLSGGQNVASKADRTATA
jgi:hypothetical protein